MDRASRFSQLRLPCYVIGHFLGFIYDIHQVGSDDPDREQRDAKEAQNDQNGGCPPFDAPAIEEIPDQEIQCQDQEPDTDREDSYALCTLFLIKFVQNIQKKFLKIKFQL